MFIMRCILFVLVNCFVVSISAEKHHSSSDTTKYVQTGHSKLMKVLGWLVSEENDHNADKLDSHERVAFVNLVYPLDNLCVHTRDNVVNCKPIVEVVENNHYYRNNFDIKKIVEASNIGSADAVKPYGVYTLLEWALEFGNNIQSRVPDGFLLPEDPAAMVRFIVTHKDDIWGRIKEGTCQVGGGVRENPDVTSLQNYILENITRMGWSWLSRPTEKMMQSALLIFTTDHDLMKVECK